MATFSVSCDLSSVYAQVCVQIASSYKGSSHIGSGPTKVTLFYLNYLFKGSDLQIHSKVLGIGTSTYKFGGKQFSLNTGGNTNFPF